MRDHHQGAGPTVQHVLDRSQGVGVQVVGRLVQQQHVRSLEQQPQELQPAAFAAGQLPDRRPGPFPAEAEPLQQLGGGQLLAADLRGPADRLGRLRGPHPLDRGELCQVLAEQTGLDGLAPPYPAGGGRQLAGEHPQQGGLAGPVRAQDADPVAGPEPPGDPVQHGPVAEREAGILQVEHVLAQPGGGQPAQRHVVPGRRFVGDQFGGGLDPEPRLAGPGRRAATQPGQLLAQQVLPAALGSGGDPAALGPGQHIGGVATLVALHLAVVHLPGAVADLVQEPPVVGDHRQAGAARRPARLQVPGQPVHPLEVEVVGRLVQQQHLGVGHQQPGQRHPPPLATGQRGQHGVGTADADRVQPAEQAGEHLADLRVAGPDMLRGVPQHCVPDVDLAGDRLVVLIEQADPQVSPVGDPAAVRRLPAGEHPQQGALAAAVAADHADPVAVVQAERDLVEHPAFGVGDGDGFQVQQMRHLRLAAAPARGHPPPGPAPGGRRGPGPRRSAPLPGRARACRPGPGRARSDRNR